MDAISQHLQLVLTWSPHSCYRTLLWRMLGDGKNLKADIICGVPSSLQWNTKRELVTRWTLFPASSQVCVNAFIFNSS